MRGREDLGVLIELCTSTTYEEVYSDDACVAGRTWLEGFRLADDPDGQEWAGGTSDDVDWSYGRATAL